MQTRRPGKVHTPEALGHLEAVDEWLAEMDAEHGPVPPETLDWAGRIIQDWESAASKPAASS